MGLKRHDELEPQRPADLGRQVRYPSPNIEDLVVVEDLPILPSKYKALKYGTQHPDYANNGLVLVWQGPVKAANNQVRVRRVYATDQETPDDWYNYAIKFSGDAVANPIFIRSTIVLRKDYTPTARGTTIADPNEGAPTGQVPTFNQPLGAVLVKEETSRLESDDQQLNSLFIRVHRVYEVFPGPWIPFTRYDDDLGPIQGRRRAVLNTGQAASLAVATKTTYEGRDGSTIVSFEIEETWDDAQFPENYAAFYDDDRGEVQSVSKLVERTGFEVGTLLVSGGVATQISYKGYNKFLLRQTIETWAEPGPIKTDDSYDDERGAVEMESREVENTGLEVGTLLVSGGVATLVEYKGKNEKILVQTVTVWALPGPVLRDKERYDDDYGKVSSTRRLLANTGQVQVEGAASRKRYTVSKYGPEVLWETTEMWDTAAFPIKVSDDYDKARGPVQVASRLIAAVGTEEGSLGVVGSTATYIHYESVNEFLLKRLTETWTVPGIELITRSLGQDNLIPAKYRRLVTRAETNQQVAADYTFPIALTGDQTYIELAEESAALARLKIINEIIDVDAEPLEGSDTDEQGLLSITEEIVTEGTAADEGFLVKNSTVTALGNGLAIKITISYTSFPVFEGTKIDENLRLVLPYTKQIVAAGTAGGIVGDTATEIEPRDKWRSISIASRIPEDLSELNETYPVTRNHIFPDTVTAVELVSTWASAGNATNESFSYDLALKYRMKSGYRGPCDGQVIETYTTSPSLSSYPVTKFFPEEFLATSTFWYYFASDTNVHTQARVFQFKLPSSLHAAYDLTPSTPPAGEADSLFIPATDPVALPASGTLITVDRDSERWRFGIWRNRVTQVYVP